MRKPGVEIRVSSIISRMIEPCGTQLEETMAPRMQSVVMRAMKSRDDGFGGDEANGAVRRDDEARAGVSRDGAAS